MIENLEMRISRTESDQRSLPIPDRNAAGSSSRSRPQTAHNAQRSASGQTEKNSVGAYVFRVAPNSGHCPMQSACLKGAKNGNGFLPSISDDGFAGVARRDGGELALEGRRRRPAVQPSDFGRSGGQRGVMGLRRAVDDEAGSG